MPADRPGAGPSIAAAAAAATHWDEHMGFFPMQVRWPRIAATANWRESLPPTLGPARLGRVAMSLLVMLVALTHTSARRTMVRPGAKVSDKQVQVSEREIIDQCDLEAMSLSDPRLDALRAARESMLQRSRRRLPALLVTFAIELMVAFVITTARRSPRWSHGDACPRRMPLTHLSPIPNALAVHQQPRS